MDEDKVEEIVEQLNEEDKEKLRDVIKSLDGDDNMNEEVKMKGIATVREKDPETGEVLSEETVENTVVAVGMEIIADYIAGNTVSDDFSVMAIGDNGDGTQPTVDDEDTSLSNRVKESTVDTGPRTITDSTAAGYDRVVEWVHTYNADDTLTNDITEMGMFDTTLTDGSEIMLNHIDFIGKDLINNDVELTYRLTVGSVTE